MGTGGGCSGAGSGSVASPNTATSGRHTSTGYVAAAPGVHAAALKVLHDTL